MIITHLAILHNYKVMLCKLPQDAIPEVRLSFCNMLLVHMWGSFWAMRIKK